MKDLRDLGGSYIVEKRGSVPYYIFSEIYPEYEWLPWRFNRVVPGYWDDVNNQKKFMEWASKELKIKDMSDWYNVTEVTRYYKLNNNFTRNLMRLGVTVC
jgi:hypothetical protein